MNAPERTIAADSRPALLERETGWRAALVDTVLPYSMGTLVVVLAISFGFAVIPLNQRHPQSESRVDVLSATAAWDGQWYRRIATAGYTYRPGEMSEVVFYPLYPLLAKPLVAAGVRAEAALLIVSNGAFVGFLLALRGYLRARGGISLRAMQWTLLAIAVWPFGFFLRMAYSESLLLCIAAVFLRGVVARWPLGALALLAAAATATRPVGVVLVAVLMLEAFQRGTSLPGRLLRAGGYGLLGMGGLLAFAAYLGWKFGNPLAFAEAQQAWNMRPPRVGAGHLLELVTLQPVWDVYREGCLCHWSSRPPRDAAPMNMFFWNPIVFLGTAALVGLGWWRGYLTRNEILIAAGMLAIPYFTQAYRTCMASQARYALQAFPAFIVAGHLLAERPGWLSAQLIALAAIGLFAFASLFISWYWVY